MFYPCVVLLILSTAYLYTLISSGIFIFHNIFGGQYFQLQSFAHSILSNEIEITPEEKINYLESHNAADVSYPNIVALHETVVKERHVGGKYPIF